VDGKCKFLKCKNCKVRNVNFTIYRYHSAYILKTGLTDDVSTQGIQHIWLIIFISEHFPEVCPCSSLLHMTFNDI